jgi:hypothetical protein
MKRWKIISPQPLGIGREHPSVLSFLTTVIWGDKEYPVRSRQPYSLCDTSEISDIA